MANPSYMLSLLGSLDKELRAAFRGVFDYAFKNIKFGQPDAASPSVNFGASFHESTTPSTQNKEFVIAHRLGQPPYLAIPILPLGSSGFEVVPLVTSRPADAQYVYLRSTSTSAVIRLFLEGGGG